MYQDAETLEVETKRFEDLEFQQLERESRQDEEKETQTQHILREIAEYQRSTVTRKVSFLDMHSSAYWCLQVIQGSSYKNKSLCAFKKFDRMGTFFY